MEDLEKRAFAAKTSGQLAIVVVPIIMVSIATCAVVLRFYSRRLTKADLWVDDWMVLMALVRCHTHIEIEMADCL